MIHRAIRIQCFSEYVLLRVQTGGIEFDTWAISAAPSSISVFGSSSKKNAKHTCKTKRKRGKKMEKRNPRLNSSNIEVSPQESATARNRAHVSTSTASWLGRERNRPVRHLRRPSYSVSCFAVFGPALPLDRPQDEQRCYSSM